MISVDTDISKQLLIIRFEKTVTVEEAEAAIERINRCLADLDTGFYLFTDFSDLEFMDDACAPSIIKTMENCREKGIARIYRVIPDPTKDIGFNIMARFHYGHDVHVVTFENRNEADEAMAKLG